MDDYKTINAIKNAQLETKGRSIRFTLELSDQSVVNLEFGAEQFSEVIASLQTMAGDLQRQRDGDAPQVSSNLRPDETDYLSKVNIYVEPNSRLILLRGATRSGQPVSVPIPEQLALDLGRQISEAAQSLPKGRSPQSH